MRIEVEIEILNQIIVYLQEHLIELIFTLVVTVTASVIVAKIKKEIPGKPKVMIRKADNRFIKKHPEKFESLDVLFGDTTITIYDSCTKTLEIENRYDSSIILNKIRMDVKEIKVDDRPVLRFHRGDMDDKGVYLEIMNTGFGDATDVELNIESSNIDLKKYFKEDQLTWKLPLIRIGESKRVLFFENKNLINKINENVHFKVTIVSKNQSVVLELNEHYLQINNDHIEFDGDIGAANTNIYGILIDTDKEQYSDEEEIEVEIPAKKHYLMYFCFSPKKSCDLKMNLSFQYMKDGKEREISTGFKKFTFKVSSINGEYGENVYEQTMSQLKKLEAENATVSFPGKSINETSDYFDG